MYVGSQSSLPRLAWREVARGILQYFQDSQARFVGHGHGHGRDERVCVCMLGSRDVIACLRLEE